MGRFYIGIDDTDVIGSPGTGHHARELAERLEEDANASINGITRHQLLIHPDVPYTSRNSSACIELDINQSFMLEDFCINYLLEIAPEGSDIGLCIIEKEKSNGELLNWGVAAKNKVLKQEWAVELAAEKGVFLKGLTGNQDGVIGALAAVGLRSGGNDGRFVWLRGNRELRDLIPGEYTAERIMKETGIDRINAVNGTRVLPADKILAGEWIRPLLINDKPVLTVEKNDSNNDIKWKTLPKEYIRSIS